MMVSPAWRKHSRLCIQRQFPVSCHAFIDTISIGCASVSALLAGRGRMLHEWQTNSMTIFVQLFPGQNPWSACTAMYTPRMASPQTDSSR
jgi:hypothetical protein